MNENDLKRLQEEVVRLRHTYRVQRGALYLCVLGIVVLSGLEISEPRSALATTTDNEGNLHVRGVIVEDQSGHERVRLGAPLPDPIIHGVRYKRKGPISGLSISDSDGNERGGMVTSDQYSEAFIGLDSQNEQQVLFLVNPKGGVNFDLFDGTGNEANLTVFPKGPKFIMRHQKETLAELPVAVKK